MENLNKKYGKEKANKIKQTVLDVAHPKKDNLTSIDVGVEVQKENEINLKEIFSKEDLSREYIFCNMLPIVNYEFYEDILISKGIKKYDSIRIQAINQDSSFFDLFANLGYNIMQIGVPIIYFVDSFTSLKNNCFWTTKRNIELDIIVDRHTNVVKFKDLIVLNA